MPLVEDKQPVPLPASVPNKLLPHKKLDQGAMQVRHVEDTPFLLINVRDVDYNALQVRRRQGFLVEKS